MTYTAAAGIGIVAALLVDLVVLRTRLVTRAVFWWTYPLLVIFQLIANGVLTGRGVVRYAPDAIIGWRIAYAPVEDLGFGFALVLCTLSVWVWLGRLGLDRRPMAGERIGPRRRAATGVRLDRRRRSATDERLDCEHRPVEDERLNRRHRPAAGER